jgi:hypothetical protein
VRDRLDEPLRVAVAGRVKSGKSTLLNALVGERLAPTDAGECTRIVTWYRDGHTYQVTARPRRANPVSCGSAARTTRSRSTSAGSPRTVDELVVTWPSQALRTATLIDTPGIGSLSEQVSRRAWDLLTAAEDEETAGRRVLYLMRHLHASDLEFLRAFRDVEVSRPNPVNAIGALAADEIGVGRIDSMASPGDREPALPRTERTAGWCRPSSRSPVAGGDGGDADRDRGGPPRNWPICRSRMPRRSCSPPTGS